MARKRSLDGELSFAQKCEAFGFDRMVELVEGGTSHSEIAKKIEVDKGAFSRWIHADDQRSARMRAAMELSAESWLDRGLDAVEEAKDPIALMRAKLVAQECARRAAIRNPRYSDKRQVEHSGGVALTVVSEFK